MAGTLLETEFDGLFRERSVESLRSGRTPPNAGCRAKPKTKFLLLVANTYLYNLLQIQITAMPDFEPLVERIYEAATDAELWPEALHDVAGTVQAAGGALRSG